MARFYRLAIEPTLFGGLVLHRTWGRLGTWGQSRLVYCADLDTAHEHRARLTAQKLRKGYCPVASPCSRAVRFSCRFRANRLRPGMPAVSPAGSR
ncbi:WGR domain-containing protein [Roseibium salinum]|uniref:WGR domain-containing protein n=1 Tax=Roseibium salinum TaxID=1604349 RepID=UPI00361101DE